MEVRCTYRCSLSSALKCNNEHLTRVNCRKAAMDHGACEAATAPPKAVRQATPHAATSSHDNTENVLEFSASLAGAGRCHLLDNAPASRERRTRQQFCSLPRVEPSFLCPSAMPTAHRHERKEAS